MKEKEYEDQIIRTMRAMQWERVKGGLEAMKQTFWGDSGYYDKFVEHTNNFIKTIEDNGLQE
jgi:hypothetical protein